MNTSVYIQGMGLICAQERAAVQAGPQAWCPYPGAARPAEEASYAGLLPPLALRRTGKLVKRALYTAREALHQARVEVPSAILAGTGIGNLGDSERFLQALCEQGEQGLPPSAFIHTTHNTVAAQLAIHLKCHGYNTTHMQGRVSFDSALFEALLRYRLCQEAGPLLVFGFDEFTPRTTGLLQKVFAPELEGNTQGFVSEGTGTFVLGTEGTPGSLCRIEAMALDYASKPRTDSAAVCRAFLAAHHLPMPEAVWTSDRLFTAFDRCPLTCFTDYSGAWFTSSALGLYGAAALLRQGAHRSLLLHHHALHKHHSLLYLTATER